MPPSLSRAARIGTPSWYLILAMAVALCVTQYARPFTIDPIRALPVAAVLVVLTIALTVGKSTGRPRLWVGARAFLQMTLFTILGVVLAYALAAKAGDLWDARLAAADRMLGIDWPAVLRGLDAFPLAIWLLGIAYHSLTLQMIVVIVALSGLEKFRTLNIAVCAAIASGFVTILISGAMPAMGNAFDPTPYRHLWPSVAWLERDLITGLRDGSLRVLDLTMLMGIVSFPSFHATLAAIFIWAFRAVPRFGGVGQLWALLTIVATPVFGGHYGVDVVMGLLLAPPAIRLARTLHPPSRPAHPTVAAMPSPSATRTIAAASDTPPCPAISVASSPAERR